MASPLFEIVASHLPWTGSTLVNPVFAALSDVPSGIVWLVGLLVGLVVICELAGLRFQAHDGGFTSRLSSKVELISASSGTKVWERELGEVEDQCRCRRRDNYVSAKIRLPSTVPPGSYRLRLSQTDQTAHQSASAELPLSITR